MSSVDDWLDLMPFTVTVEPFVDRDAYQVPTYGALSSYRARVVNKNTRVRSPEGEEVVSPTHAWLATTDDIGNEDRVTLPDGSQPKILSVEEYPDDDGNHHIKVFFQ